MSAVMSAGEICGRLYTTGQLVRLGWRDGVITEWRDGQEDGREPWWLAPPLVDLQVNGFAGVDFQQDELSVDDLMRANRGLAQAGCGRWLLTLTTDRWPRMLKRLERLRALRAGSVELRSAIAGWHVEGPFLSSEPGYHGAHDPALMLDPSLDRIRELRAVTGTDPVLLTIAPERRDALAAIALAGSLGMRVSLGHTNASAEQLEQAVLAGARGFTHFGNACPQQLDRHDNILWRVLDRESLGVGLIADGIHVSGPLFRLVHRVLGWERVYYTTDAMAAAGASPGRYTLGELTVEAGGDQVVRQPGRTNFAGSALRPIDGVFRAARMLGCSWRETWEGFSERPAWYMGLPGGLEVGGKADFCLLRVNGRAGGGEGGEELVELRLFRAGEQIH
jgi:N-acetylglucosamine-6-phosphate deacetylase